MNNKKYALQKNSSLESKEENSTKNSLCIQNFDGYTQAAWYNFEVRSNFEVGHGVSRRFHRLTSRGRKLEEQVYPYQGFYQNITLNLFQEIGKKLLYHEFKDSNVMLEINFQQYFLLNMDFLALGLSHSIIELFSAMYDWSKSSVQAK